MPAPLPLAPRRAGGALRGPKNRYRQKLRTPIPILLTRRGHVLFHRLKTQHGLSAGDLVEFLVRKECGEPDPPTADRGT